MEMENGGQRDYWKKYTVGEPMITILISGFETMLHYEPHVKWSTKVLAWICR